MSYQEFLEKKKIVHFESGFETPEEDISPNLKDFQKLCVKKALVKGKYCIWAGCGLGKSLMILEWSTLLLGHCWSQNKEGRVLILAPLSVAKQFVREADKFNYSFVKYLTEDDNKTRIVVTNYERLDNFDVSKFTGVVIDECSILKSFDGKTRDKIIGAFKDTKYKLGTSATPAPNDYMELGNQAEFVGAMTRNQMLAMFFTHDASNTSKWRLKHHSQSNFWDWVSTWAIAFENPSELNFNDVGYDLPTLTYHYSEVPSKFYDKKNELKDIAITLTEQRLARKQSLEDRVLEVAKIVNNSNEQWLVFCDLNDESKLLNQMIFDSVEVTGSQKLDKKEANILSFINGESRVLVSKPSIVGMGMNFQHCQNIIYASITHSFESFYQSVRRCWRFGQEKPVSVHIVYSTPEQPVLDNIFNKEVKSKEMLLRLNESMFREHNQTAYQHKQPVYNPTIEYQAPKF